MIERNKENLGLTTLEASKRIQEWGKNEVVPSDVQSFFLEFLRFFKDPMGLMMLGLALIYFLLGEKKDALIMLIAFVPVSAVDVFLEIRAEKALHALKATFQPTAKVFRDGILKEIPIQEIVPGDIIALEEGQSIPADGRIISSAGLSVSESALTGESVPINKVKEDEIYAGTLILTGRGTYEVTQTGKRTKFGKIVELLQTTEEEKSPLQRKVNRLVTIIVRAAIILVICLFVLELFRGKSFLQSLLISLTFGMAAVPEEFPLVFTLYLSLGAWRLARNGVLVKSLPSVETLGSIDVICTDKTGTLTEGKFQLNKIVPYQNFTDEECWKFAVLACEPIVVDAMELAIKEKMPDSTITDGQSLIYDYPFETEGKHMSHAWKNTNGETLVTMKGAIEGVLAHCSNTKEEKIEISKLAEKFSSEGYRLLGLAGKSAPISGNREKDEQDVSFMGILVFSDPIRETAKRAIQVCQEDGIQVKMITGDHPLTAHAIADQLNLNHDHNALYTGADLRVMSDEKKLDAFRLGAIFSRVTPEQKYELVHALKKEGFVVAMTGDGVNDAPAMKIADIGISMGDNATDAARATAKMVLTKNDFNGIVYAIQEGRKIFSNLKKSFSYLVSFHIPVVLLAFIPPLFNLGEMLLPIHIILLELIVHPVSAFTFENFEHDTKKVSRDIIDRLTFATSLLAGVLVSSLAIIFFLMLEESSLEEKRTVALTTIIFGNIGFILLETMPKFTRRLVITGIILVIVGVSLAKVPVVMDHLHLAEIEQKWIWGSLTLGLLASLPSWIIRRSMKASI